MWVDDSRDVIRLCIDKHFFPRRCQAWRERAISKNLGTCKRRERNRVGDVPGDPQVQLAKENVWTSCNATHRTYTILDDSLKILRKKICVESFKRTCKCETSCHMAWNLCMDLVHRQKENDCPIQLMSKEKVALQLFTDRATNVSVSVGTNNKVINKSTRSHRDRFRILLSIKVSTVGFYPSNWK